MPPGRISGIVNGNRAITVDTALRLGKYFSVSSQTCMGLQAEHDLRVAQCEIGEEVEKRVYACAAQDGRARFAYTA
ncbi:MAG: antitoxin HigA [Pseudomonadota bacterium]|nr:antitoxin HigA [Pseudomonadota bacterium]